MSKTVVKSNSNKKVTPKTKSVEWNFPLNKTDLIWLAIGVAVVIIGHLLLATGLSDEPAIPDGTWNNILVIHFAPIVLFLGYCVIIPLSLFKFFSRRKDKKNAK